MDSKVNDEVFVGMDVGAGEIVLVLRTDDKSGSAQKFLNTDAGHRKLVQKIAKNPGSTVCMEATGVYSMGIAIALSDAGIRLMVINPQASHNFSKVLGKHSKTDLVDADTLAQYAQRMPFRPWVRPANEAMELRIISRRMHALTDEKTAQKNQQHALLMLASTPKIVLADLELGISQLEKRIEALTTAALELVKAHQTLRLPFELMLGVKGIANTSAIALLGEFAMLPKGLSHTQWVSFAGLDPKHFTSGTSVEKKARISKAGNHYIRAALYMPALSAKARDPYVKGFFEHLIAMGKTPMQAVCAVMRKLLHALHGMITNNQPWDNTRFYAHPVTTNVVST